MRYLIPFLLAGAAIAAHLHVTPQTVGKWRRRFVDGRVPGLLDEPRPGAPRKIGDAEIERVLTTDPGMGVIRHVDAGYEEAAKFASKNGVKVPMPV